MNNQLDEFSARQRVHALLSKTHSLKLLEGDPNQVLEIAREAYNLAKATNMLSPWREVAAYRLSQLLFRLPSKDLEQFREIDVLLKESGGNTTSAVSPLGPLPWIYRMACLHRLSIIDPTNKDEYFKSIVETRAAALRRFTTSANNRQRSLSPQEDDFSRAQIQTDQFNLVELATYFVDLPYSQLRGMGGRNEDGFPLSGSWILISNQIGLTDIRYTREYAEAELEALLASKPKAIGFILEGKNTSGSWTKDHNSNRRITNSKPFVLLSSVLFCDDLTSSKLQTHLGVGEENLRQMKRRLCESLNQQAGKDVVRFADRSYRLETAIPIFGAINTSVLHGL